MLGIPGLPDMLFIMLLALLVFGPRRLPEIGRMVGRALAEFRKASNELRRTLHTELALEQESSQRTFPALAYRTPSAAPEGTQTHVETTADGGPEAQQAEAQQSTAQMEQMAQAGGQAGQAEQAGQETTATSSAGGEQPAATASTGDAFSPGAHAGPALPPLDSPVQTPPPPVGTSGAHESHEAVEPS